MVASWVPIVTSVSVPPCFSTRRKPSSTALAAMGSSSWGTPFRTMRLVLASSSIMVVLVGITLPHTTTFNVLISLCDRLQIRQRRLYDQGALSVKLAIGERGAV